MERERLEDLLEKMGAGDERAERELLTYIMEQPEGIRVLAFEALERGGDDWDNQLMLTLADDPSLQIRSSKQQRTLSQIAPRDLGPTQVSTPSGARSQAPEDMLTSLRIGERSRRVQAARALSQYSDPATVAALIEAIRSGDKQVAAAAVESLQSIGKPAVPALQTATAEERNEQNRWSFVKALSAIRDDRSVPELVRALEDANYGTRWLAAEGLARIGRPTLVPLLRRLAEGKASAWLKDGAWHTLNKIGVTDSVAREHYRQLGTQIKQTSTANIPHLAREELRRLGEDA